MTRCTYDVGVARVFVGNHGDEIEVAQVRLQVRLCRSRRFRHSAVLRQEANLSVKENRDKLRDRSKPRERDESRDKNNFPRQGAGRR